MSKAPRLRRFRRAVCIEGEYQMFNSNATGQPNLATFELVVGKYADMGYQGVETVGPLIGPESTDDYRRVCERFEVELVGVHWMLAKTEGLHLTNPDPAVMKRTVDYIVKLAKKTVALGGKIMVHGSPNERNLLSHLIDHESAMETSVENYLRVMEQIGDLPVWIAMEQLTTLETEFLITLAAVRRMIERVKHPHFRMVLDTKAIWQKAPSSEQVAEMFRLFGKHAVHCHVNDINKGRPGSGVVNFVPILQALADIKWHEPHPELGTVPWVSMEVFDTVVNPLEISARDSMAYLDECEDQVRFAV